MTSEQRPLFDKIKTGITENLQGFTTQRSDGSLIGPFSALLHFPAYGTPVWDLFLALAGTSVLPKAAREVVILATAARFGSLYELYSHEAVAATHRKFGDVKRFIPDAKYPILCGPSCTPSHPSWSPVMRYMPRRIGRN